jgi:hypothetical protein
MKKPTSALFLITHQDSRSKNTKTNHPDNTPIQTCTPKEQTNHDNLFHRNHKRQRRQN